MKYYYVVFNVWRCGWKPKSEGGASTGSSEKICTNIINENPLGYVLRMNMEYGNQHDTGNGYTGREEHTLLNFIEITKEEYDKYNGYFG